MHIYTKGIEKLIWLLKNSYKMLVLAGIYAAMNILSFLAFSGEYICIYVYIYIYLYERKYIHMYQYMKYMISLIGYIYIYIDIYVYMYI